jgi:peptidyl-prolyl cis-trans isomerase SurA
MANERAPLPPFLRGPHRSALQLAVAGLFVLLVNAIAPAQEPTPTPPVPDRVLATVNGTIITARDVEFRFYEWRLLNNFPRDIPVRELQRDLLAATVFEELLYQRVWQPRMEVDDAEIANWSMEALERYQRLAGGARELRRSLTDVGHDEAAFVRWIEREARRQWVLDQGIMACVDPALLNRSDETSSDATRVWIARIHVEARLPGDERSMSRARELAASLRARAIAGDDFFELANVASDEVLATRGGDLGWIEVDALREEIREVVLGLKLNAVSEPVRVPTGWQIYKLLDYETPARRQLLEAIRRTRAEELKAALRESDVRLASGLELEQILAGIDLQEEQESVWDRIRTAPSAEEATP